MLNSLHLSHITVDDISYLYSSAVQVHVLRLDKFDPVISGNKWFKLRFYLEEAIQQQKKGLITFGGAWSNHIVATAAACQQLKLQSIGIIRGEEPANWSPALLDAKLAGMQLLFIPREDYSGKHVPAVLHELKNEYLLVPEGGYGIDGARGASTIPDVLSQPFTHYICAAGTGTMTAGLINAAPSDSEVTAISVLKNNYSLEPMITDLLHESPARWSVLHDYHFGGYAKHKPPLLAFMNSFFERTRIPTDFVYTGKLFYAVDDLIRQSRFPAGSRILVIHSGGLQGNRSLPKGTLNF
ncbi:MAG: 1-aminocyclopropane-1-carboxylate deaminase [Citrobacter freundii]|nr:MAG: 1-aminocyclopropane-1-carboxylate deaminase [Citrobacter freundii]